MNKKVNKIFPYAIAAFIIIIGGLLYYYMFGSMTDKDNTVYLYIDDNDNIDSVFAKVAEISNEHGTAGFRTLARHMELENDIHTGRYAIDPSDGAFTLLRHIRNGMQEPLSLTIPEVRTVDKLAAYLSTKMMLDSADIAAVLADTTLCRKYGKDVSTMITLFVPNTYEVYWDTSIEKFLKRMMAESEKFWNKERRAKAASIGLTPEEVMTLASIIDEETANNAEKPMVAGMYLNRLREDMPLQADPTIRYALNDFTIRRVRNNMLRVNSPYNTYTNKGLPPGPIRIASVAAIDAVLNATKHDYLYMCAKEDFSGTHNFARTYDEHLKNAARYTDALNKRGIK